MPGVALRDRAYINELVARTGLDPSVVTAWATMENGVNNNVLGVTGSNGRLLSFSSQRAGADAAAALLGSSGQYSGIMAAARHGTAQDQAMAIATSPWRLGGAGLQSAGGVDAYYLKGFQSAGLVPQSDGGSPLSWLGGIGAAIANPTSTAARAGASAGAGASSSVARTLTDAASAPFLYIGVMLVSSVLILVGGIVLLKPRVQQAAQAAAPIIAAAA